MAIDLVIFDLGRVLIQICDDWRHACRCAGVALPEDLPDLTDDERAGMEAAIARYDTGKVDAQTFSREVARFRKLTPQQALAAHDAYLRGPYPGVDELLDDLAKLQVRTACLSNTSELHWRQMTDAAHQNFLPLHRLDWRFASHLIGVMKPDAEIYQHVERATRIAPQSLVFFDDLQANVAAAAQRGWRTHQIRIDADPIAQVRQHLRAHGLNL